jgi:hypothetical protein
MRMQQKSKTEQLQEIINDYLEETKAEEVEMREVAAWAIRKGRWEMPRGDKIKQCAAELARAAREEMFEDPQGRSVRKKHAYRVKDGETQQVFWADIDDIQTEKMRLSLQQRRRGVLSDCKQLNNDRESYNENYNAGEPIAMSFNFDEDLAEMNQSPEYPEVPPEEDDQ